MKVDYDRFFPNYNSFCWKLINTFLIKFSCLNCPPGVMCKSIHKKLFLPINIARLAVSLLETYYQEIEVFFYRLVNF